MSFLVVGARTDDGWSLEVADLGTTTSPTMAGIEPAARALLAEHGVADADTVDLQLLLPDFEVDLQAGGVPEHRLSPVALASGLIALVVVIGAITFVLTLLLT